MKLSRKDLCVFLAQSIHNENHKTHLLKWTHQGGWICMKDIIYKRRTIMVFFCRRAVFSVWRRLVQSCVPTPPLPTAAVQSVVTVCTRAMYRNTAVCLRQGGTPVNNASVGSVTTILTFCDCFLINLIIYYTIFLSSMLSVSCNMFASICHILSSFVCTCKFLLIVYFNV